MVLILRCYFVLPKGFDISEDEIFTSLTAARRLIEADKLHPLLLLEDSAREDFEGVVDGCTQQQQHDCVVVGLAPSRFGYTHLNQAFRYRFDLHCVIICCFTPAFYCAHACRLLLGGSRLIAIHRAKYYKKEDGIAIGPGPYVAALEYASGCTAQVVGKPEPSFFNSVLKEIDCPISEAVMIGDVSTRSTQKELFFYMYGSFDYSCSVSIQYRIFLMISKVLKTWE